MIIFRKIIDALEYLNTDFDVSLVINQHFRILKYEIMLFLGRFMKVHLLQFRPSETNVYQSKISGQQFLAGNQVD